MQLFNQTQIAEKLNVSRQTVYLWRKRGCPHIKNLGIVRFDYDKVVEWLSVTGSTEVMKNG